MQQKEFIARGLASREQASEPDSCFDAENVTGELRTMLTQAKMRKA